MLLVDDSPVNLLVATTMLERCGLEVVPAENGREALERLGAQRFDLVLMDCQMPELDGFAATAAWRQEEARRLLPRTPVVALTASAVDDDRARCLAAGMDDYLVKPFEMDELLAVVTRHLPAIPTDNPPPMQVFRGFHHPGIAAQCALTIGNFDGVHRGHQAMLALLLSARPATAACRPAC